MSSPTPSVEPIVRSRLLPRVSFRSMMILMAVSAVVLAVARSANQGGIYATAAVMGLVFLLGTVIVLSAVFLLAWAVAHARRPVGLVLLSYSVAMIALSIAGLRLDWINEPIVVLNTFFIGVFLLFVPPPSSPADHLDSPFAADRLPPQILPPRDAQS
ncbi:hypothetical protein [Stieleria varia]|nr:hypothetical protein [Stieleria varia]